MVMPVILQFSCQNFCTKVVVTKKTITILEIARIPSITIHYIEQPKNRGINIATETKILTEVVN